MFMGRVNGASLNPTLLNGAPSGTSQAVATRTESEQRVANIPITASHLYVHVSVAPGTGGFYSVHIEDATTLAGIYCMYYAAGARPGRRRHERRRNLSQQRRRRGWTATSP